jgi:FkbM family methyltransferase
MKRVVNSILKKFGVEAHGIGYLEKLSRSSFKNDAFEVQQSLFSEISRGRKGEGIIVDVGANRGGTALRYLEFSDEAKIHCFEPTPAHLETLRKRFHGSPRVHVHDCGLGSIPGTMTMHINRMQDTNSLLESTLIGATSDKSCETVGEIEIEIRTLDEECRRLGLGSIDLLKLDVQGFELEVLRGASGLLNDRKIQVIYTETYFKPQYHKQPLFWDVGAYLCGFGFSLVDFYDLYYNDKQVLWGDAIFRLTE